MDLTIRSEPKDLWPAVDYLFGREHGASSGCWCTDWRIGRSYRRRARRPRPAARRPILRCEIGE